MIAKRGHRSLPRGTGFLRYAGLGAMALATAGCDGVLDPQGPIGVSERLILIDSLAIMLMIVIPVIVATLGFAWWFRATNTRATYLPDWAFSGRLELIVWAIPTLVITFLGGIAWFGSHALDPFKPLDSAKKPIEVEVVSLDWKWLFIYPSEGVASLNRLTIPVGVPVHFRLTSNGVMNSFFVPQLGSQIYTMSGMTSEVALQADHAGLFPGLSAHFSGDGFSDMHFDVAAVTPEAYAKWVADAKGGKTPLDTTTYAQLAKQSTNLLPVTYKSIDPMLFGTIVNGTATPAGAPESASGGQDEPARAHGGT